MLISSLLFLLAPFSISKGKENNFNPNDFKVNVPEFKESPEIDGVLENPLWLNGTVLENFTQYEPQEGATPSEKTVAYLGHDEHNLYIALHCFDSSPRGIRANLCQRDKVHGDDEISIYLDTFNDQKRAFVFQANACGVQGDGVYTESSGHGRGGFERIDRSWDTYFTSDARIDESGYIVEMAIPFKSLRFPNSKTQTWGLQIMRTIRRKNEEIYWFPRSRNVNGLLVQSGKIEMNGKIAKGRNIEIMPVFTGMKESDEKFDPQAGINLKYGITSDLTADLTFNPDFSQVEADMPQIEVNQRYALRYDEKRPFFLEGKDFFNTPLELVYSRKVVDPLWGMKLTGKTGKTTLGFLSVLDENPPEIEIAESEEEDEDEEEEESDVPLGKAMVNIFRLKRDIFPESYLGFIFTDKEMGKSVDTIFRKYNRVAGIDGHFKFLDYYRFSFQVLGSMTKKETERTDFIPAMNFSLSRSSRHLNFSTEWTSIHPEFEAATGFFRRKDIHSSNSRLSYSFLPQTNLIVSITPSVEYRRIYDYHQTLTDDEYEFSLFFSGWRQTNIWGTFTSGLERYNEVDFYKKEYRINLSSEAFSWLSGNMNYSFGDGIYYGENPYLGYKNSLSMMITFKPLSNLKLFYNIKNNEFYKKRGGEKVYEINIISQRITYQFSRPLSLRLITDYNDYDKEFYASLLLSYELRPGTVFYIGIDDNQAKDESGIFRSQGRYFFIKFSYWWRT